MVIRILSWAHRLPVRTYPPIKPSAIARVLRETEIKTSAPTYVTMPARYSYITTNSIHGKGPKIREEFTNSLFLAFGGHSSFLVVGNQYEAMKSLLTLLATIIEF